MARRVKVIDGTPYTRDEGRWRPLTDRERIAYETGPLQAFGIGVASFPESFIRSGAQLAPPDPALIPPQLEASRAVEAGGIHPTTQAAADVAQFHPAAVAAGQAAPILATVPPSSWKSLAQLPQTIAQRVNARIGGMGAFRSAQGLERTLGERTGSRAIQSVEAAVGSQGGFGFLARRREQLIGRAAARSMGEIADDVGTAVRARAAERIGAGMDDLLSREFTLGGQTREALQAIPNPGGKLKPLITRLDDMQGPVAGDYIKNLRRQLTDRLRSAVGKDDLLADDLRNALDSLMEDIGMGLSPGEVDQWRALRQEYKNLMLLETIPEVRHSGSLTARQAGNALNKSYGTAYLRGRGTGHEATDEFMSLTHDMAELRAIPDSGTATRAIPAITAGMAASGGDPIENAGQAAAGAAAPYLVSAALGRALLAAGRALP